MKWIKIPVEIKAIRENEILKINAGKKLLCLLKHNNEFFATKIKCPHAGADLSQGKCLNGEIECPFHWYRYNLKTGIGAANQGDYLHTYPVKIENKELFIGFTEAWWKIW